jgi:hypothetical protein
VPPLTLENCSALVPGGGTPADIEKERKSMQQPNQAPPKTLEVKVVRSFMNHERRVLKAGERATLPRIFALEMKAANKVEIIEPAPAAPAKAEEKSASKSASKKEA